MIRTLLKDLPSADKLRTDPTLGENVHKHTTAATAPATTSESVMNVLKSGSHQVGANGLAKLCQDIENEAWNNHYDVSGATLELIKQQFTQAQAALVPYLG